MAITAQTVGLILVGAVMFVGPIPLTIWLLKKKGYRATWAWLAAIPIVGWGVVCTTMLLPNRQPSADAPKPRGAAEIPREFVGVMMMILGAVWGQRVAGDGWPSHSNLSTSGIVGAACGLVIGILMSRDSRQVRERREEAMRAVDGGALTAASAVSLPVGSRDVMGLALVALPMAAGLVGILTRLFHWPGVVAVWAADVAILGTSAIAYFDLRDLLLRSPPNRDQDTSINIDPGMTTLSLVGMWGLCYPLYFAIRRRLGATNYVLPGLLATAILLGPPLVSRWLGGSASTESASGTTESTERPR